MPSVSEAQRKMFFATKGAKWTREHGFDKLARSKRKSSRNRKSSRK